MKTKTLLLVLAGVALVTAFAVRATLQINKANQAMAALATQSATSRANIARLEQRLRAAKDGLAQAAIPTASALGQRSANAVTATSTDGATKPKTTAGRLSPETIIANDPQKMAEYSKRYRDSLDLTLGGTFKALHLTPEQIEKFKDLRVAQEQRRMDLRAAIETQGVDRYGDDSDQLSTRLFKESRKQEAELLGSGPLADQYLEYRAMWLLRETTQRLASIEVYPETPFTSAQVERVTEIIAKNNERRAENNPGKWSWQVYGWGWPDWTAINWDAATTQLQSVVSPSQLANLRQYFRPMEANAALSKRWAELQDEAQRISPQPGG